LDLRPRYDGNYLREFTSRAVGRSEISIEFIGPNNKRNGMLVTIAALLLILWFFGMVSTYTLGGFIHVLLVIAIIMVLIRIIRGERPL
jgi:hypothetical protein